jgi:hypothetical protein
MLSSLRPRAGFNNHSSRRGGIYAMVMISSATVTTIALTALSLAGEQRIASMRATDSLAATALARSAVELAMLEINTDPTWRWNRPDGWWFKDMALGDGTISVATVSLEAPTKLDNTCSQILIRAVGRVGTSRTMYEVRIAPEERWPDDGHAVAAALGAVAYWAMDASDTDEPVDDFSDQINGFDGEYYGTGLITGMECVACTTSIALNGSNNYAKISLPANMAITQGAVSLWFYMKDLSGDTGLFSRDAAGFGRGGHLTLSIADNDLSVQMQSRTTTYTVNGPSPQDGQWHHAAVTFGPGGLRLFLNGLLVGSDSYTGGWTDSGSALQNNEPVVLGGSAHNATGLGHAPIQHLLNGSIAHVSLYDRQLADGEIYTLYDATRTQGPMRYLPRTWSRVVD